MPDSGLGVAQHIGEPAGIFNGHDWIGGTRKDEDRLAAEIGFRRIGKRHHGADQDGTGQRLGAKQQNGGGDIGAIGKTYGDGGRQIIFSPRGLDEIGKIVGAFRHIGLVEDTFGESAEEARHAVLQHRAARRNQRPSRRQRAAQRNEIILVAAGAVQQEQRCSRRGAGKIAVPE